MSEPISKLKSLTSFNIRKIVGGKEPVKLIEELINRRGHDPQECMREHTGDFCRWMVPLREDQELEILVDGLKKTHETSVYLGLNVAIVPLRRTQEFLVAALELADGLVGIKVSLIGHYLVLSYCAPIGSMSPEDLEYSLSLVESQQSWFCENLSQELGGIALGE